MLFKRRFQAGIRDGSITLTFRAWKTPRACASSRHRLGPDDAIEIRAVDLVPLSGISAADARRAGFTSRDELVEVLRRTSDTRLTSRSKVYRVTFRHVHAPDPRAARRRNTATDALDEVQDRLELMDLRSRRGPWTFQVLRLLERHPKVAASKLAQRLGRETRAFKADVRKLKELGLTESHEVGYSLSPRGRAMLER